MAPSGVGHSVTMTRVMSMWQSKRDGIGRQIKRLERELKVLRKAQQQLEARGCYSDKELVVKEAQIEEYARRIRILALELNRLQLLPYAAGSGEM